MSADPTPDYGRRTLATRRILAFAVDYLVIALYIGALALVSSAFNDVQSAADIPTTIEDKLRGHLLGLVTLTLPVIAYFAFLDRGRGSVGKRLFRLRVFNLDGGKPGLGQSFGRSLVKFAPWELAHTATWYVPGRPFIDPPALLNLAGWGIALSLALVWAGAVFLGSGRTPYDRITRTRVERVPQAP